MAAAIPPNTANFGAIRGARCRSTGHAVGSPVASRAVSTVIRAVWKRGGGRIRRAAGRHADRPMTSNCRVANDEDWRVEGAFRRSDANRAVFFADSLAS
jgi:hypothetical protein